MKDLWKTALESGYSSNKDLTIKKIDSIYIEKFRTLTKKQFPLGSNITLISGKNGTMKTSLMGLIAHPFSSPNSAKDFFGKPLKTSMSDVFRLSLEKDNEIYRYYLNITTTDDISFSEPVRLYPRNKENRHRITVGKDNSSGLGNLLLNTSYTNFKRLYPLIDTNAKEHPFDQSSEKDLLKFIADGYWKIFGRDNFKKPVPISESKSSIKETFGPSDADYDFNSISSGEDNLGHLLSKLFAFQSNKTNDSNSQCLQGIFCIDEIEAGLHPIAQEKFFDFLYDWSRKNKVQIVATTHSLYLLQHAFSCQNNFNEGQIVVNMISTAYTTNNNYNIIPNPSYNDAYRELTFKKIEDIEDMYKVNILCEDDVAAFYLKRLLSKQKIIAKLDFLYGLTSQENNPGNSYKVLYSLAKNGAKLFKDSIFVFDPEVDDKYITGKFASLVRLPSLYNLPIEKEIVKYIYDLPGDSQFFKKFKMEHNDFTTQFASYRIGDLSDIDAIKLTSTSSFKNWAKSTGSKFNQYITFYVRDNATHFEQFRKDFIDIINSKLIAKSLPIFEEN